MSTDYSHFTKLAFDKLFAIGPEGQEVLLVNSLGIWVGPGGSTGIIPITRGGTGATSANGGLNALLPSQTGHSGEFLTTNGTNASWATAGGGGGSTTSISVNVLNVTSSANFAGRVKLADGTVSAPSLTFTNYLTTGLFLASAALPAFAVGGVEMLRINASGAINLGYDSGTDYNLSTSTQDLNFRGQTLRVATAATSGVVIAALNRKTGSATADAFLKAETTATGGAAYTFLSRNSTGYSIAHDTDNDFKIFSGASGTGGTVRARYEASSGKWYIGTPTTNVTHNIIGNLAITGTLAVTSTISASNLSGTNTGDVTIGTANGLSLVGQALSLAAASTSTAGVVSTGAQSFAGVKTFIVAPKFTSLSASLPLKLDGSNNVLAAAIALGGSEVTGQLPVTKGGTGATSANGGLNALLPSQTGNSGKFLTTDGSNTSWATASGTSASGVTTIGTIDSLTKSANGAVISGSLLVMQTASSSAVGLVSLTTQSFAGNKKFTGIVGIGGAPQAFATLALAGNATGADQVALYVAPSYQSAATSTVEGMAVALTVGSALSTAKAINYESIEPALSGGATVTRNIGFYAHTLTNASNNVTGIADNLSFTGSWFINQSGTQASTFGGSITASNLSGTNTGDVTIGTANGLSLVGQAISMAAASSSATGVVTTGTQSFAGTKTFVTPLLGANVANASSSAAGVVSTGTQTFNGTKTFLSTTTTFQTANDTGVVVKSTATGKESYIDLQGATSSTVDQYMLFRAAGGTSWAVGKDTSDTDAFKISRSTGLGTNDAFKIDTSNRVYISGPLDFTEISTPTTPAANHHRVYPKSTGALYKLNSAGTEIPITSGLRTVGITVNGGGVAVTTGIKGYIEIPFTGVIQGWTLLGDQSGSIVIDVWKDTYANYPPTVADTITGADKPTISSATKGQNLTLSAWTTAVTTGDTLGFNVDSCTTITRATLIIRILAT